MKSLPTLSGFSVRILRSHSRCESSPAPARCLAFTRLELLAVLGGVFLLLALAAPALCSGRAGSQTAACLNNLRQLGRAVQMWGADHGNEPPWVTSTIDGGEFITLPGSSNGGARPGLTWGEFAFMSNQIVTPRLLACPADAGVLVARDFPEYTSTIFRNRATSYFVNLHTTFEFQRGPLFGDRNVRFFVVGGCALGPNNTVGVFTSIPNVVWTNAVHGVQGNLVQVDGSVNVTTSEEMRRAFGRTAASDGAHLLSPR